MDWSTMITKWMQKLFQHLAFPNSRKNLKQSLQMLRDLSYSMTWLDVLATVLSQLHDAISGHEHLTGSSRATYLWGSKSICFDRQRWTIIQQQVVSMMIPQPLLVFFPWLCNIMCNIFKPNWSQWISFWMKSS